MAKHGLMKEKAPGGTTSHGGNIQMGAAKAQPHGGGKGLSPKRMTAGPKKK